MASEPNTVKAALIAQLMGEMDDLFKKADAVAENITAAQAANTQSILSLTDAGDRYRLAVTQFTHEAREELSAYLERKAAAVQKESISDFQIAMAEAARNSFRKESSDRANEIAKTLSHAVGEIRQTKHQRLIEISFVAILSSIITALIFYGLVVKLN